VLGLFAEAVNKTGFRVSHREMRARRSAPGARLSLIENHFHTLPNDNRQLAKNEPLDSVKLSRIALALCPDYTATYPPTSGEGGAAAPETPGLHFFQLRAQIRVLAAFRAAQPNNSSAGGVVTARRRVMPLSHPCKTIKVRVDIMS